MRLGHNAGHVLLDDALQMRAEMSSPVLLPRPLCTSATHLLKGQEHAKGSILGQGQGAMAQAHYKLLGVVRFQRLCDELTHARNQTCTQDNRAAKNFHLSQNFVRLVQRLHMQHPQLVSESLPSIGCLSMLAASLRCQMHTSADFHLICFSELSCGARASGA